jgi:hypothetical protein
MSVVAVLVEVLLLDEELEDAVEAPELTLLEVPPQPASNAAPIKIPTSRPTPPSTAFAIRARLAFSLIPKALRRSCGSDNTGLTVAWRPIRSQRCRQPRCLAYQRI